MSSRERAEWLPTETQELLLHAALEEGELALGSWDEWMARTQMLGADGTDVQILPMAWRNLIRFDAERPELERLRGVYRHSWIKNKLIVRFGAQVVRELQRDGIDALILKGAALSLLYYRDSGARSMADLDVLVPRESAHAAIAALRRTLQPDPSFPRPERRVSVHHSTPFTDGADMEVDLHWYSLWQSAPDGDFWSAAGPIELDGVGALALSPPDQLLQVTAHGACWNPGGILRWVADAVTVMRATPDLDWDRFSEQARKRELAAGLPEALTYLRSRFGADVPADVIDGLRRTPVTFSARLGRRASNRPPTALGITAMHWERYRRLRRLDPAAPREGSFSRQLAAWWDYDRRIDFSAHAARRAIARTRRLLARERKVQA